LINKNLKCQQASSAYQNIFFGHLVGQRHRNQSSNNGAYEPGNVIVLVGLVIDWSSEANRPRYVHTSRDKDETS